MRPAVLLSVVGLVQAGLASAIPALKHDRLHNARRQAAQATETVTTIFYQTVIWVDKNGSPVSTEIHNPPPGATVLHSEVAPSVDPTFTPAVAGFWGQQQKSKASSQSFQKPTARPSEPSPSSAVPDFNGSEKPKSTDTVHESKGDSGNLKESATAPGGMGICYDMIDSQTQCKTRDKINAEFSFLKSEGYGMIRVYDIGCPVGDFTAGAAQNGLKLMVGVNGIANLNGDLNKLIGMINGDWSTVDTVYIGNELVNNGAASAGQVAAAVTTARGILSGAGYNGNVVTVDTFNVMQNDATICSTSDYCAANAHAFFDPNTAASNAGQFVLNAYNNVGKANNGKKVLITESGWPWQGNCNGKACPSAENQRTAMNSIMNSFGGMPGNVFMFQAYNAGYKQPGAQGVEQYFGIYDGDHYTGGIGSS